MLELAGVGCNSVVQLWIAKERHDLFTLEIELAMSSIGEGDWIARKG